MGSIPPNREVPVVVEPPKRELDVSVVPNKDVDGVVLGVVVLTKSDGGVPETDKMLDLNGTEKIINNCFCFRKQKKQMKALYQLYQAQNLVS